MKHTLLMSSLVATTLMTAAFFASAQSPAPASDQPAAAAAQKDYTDPNDASKGQQLVGDKQPPATGPATAGQNKTTGNDLVAEKNDGRTQNGKMEHPAFRTLDSTNKGYLTADDVASHAWLSKNFARCNTSHDGHLTSQDYAKCLE